jgi:hypothetical protein
LKIDRFIIATLLISTLCIPFSGKSQRMVVLNMPNYDHEYLFHFGFVLGANHSLLTIKPDTYWSTHAFHNSGDTIPDDPIFLPAVDSAKVLNITSTPSYGFIVSIVANMQMGRNFELQFVPSLSFGGRKINYDIETYRTVSSQVSKIQTSVSKDIPSTYINLPVEIKYKAFRYNNFRPYLLTGAQYSLDLASNAKKREQKKSNEKIVKFNRDDIYLEAGVGFDFYNEWFKFGLELKMMYGLMDVLKQEGNIYTLSIDRVNSKIFQVSFTFE